MTIEELVKELETYPHTAVVTRAQVTVRCYNMTSKLDFSRNKALRR